MRVVGCAPVPNAPPTGSMTISGRPSPGGSVRRAHPQPPRDLPGPADSRRRSSRPARPPPRARAARRRRARRARRRPARRRRTRPRPAVVERALVDALREQRHQRVEHVLDRVRAQRQRDAPHGSRGRRRRRARPARRARGRRARARGAPPPARAAASPATSAASRRPRAQRSVASKRSPRGRTAGATASGPAQPACSGHSPQRGRRGRQTVAPSSIIAWFHAAARPSGSELGRPPRQRRAAARRTPSRRSITRRTLVSTAATCASHANERDRGGGVRTDAGQLLERSGGGQPLRRHDARRRLQRERAPVVAEPAPGADRPRRPARPPAPPASGSARGSARSAARRAPPASAAASPRRRGSPTGRA